MGATALEATVAQAPDRPRGAGDPVAHPLQCASSAGGADRGRDSHPGRGRVVRRTLGFIGLATRGFGHFVLPEPSPSSHHSASTPRRAPQLGPGGCGSSSAARQTSMRRSRPGRRACTARRMGDGSPRWWHSSRLGAPTGCQPHTGHTRDREWLDCPFCVEVAARPRNATSEGAIMPTTPLADPATVCHSK